MNITQYQGKKRVVLVFTPSASDARFAQQLAVFEQFESDMKDRDIVVLPIVGPAEPRLHSQFRVGVADFRTILIGKDGNEKHRWAGVAPMEQLNHRIDRMPMRRVEMKER